MGSIVQRHVGLPFVCNSQTNPQRVLVIGKSLNTSAYVSFTLCPAAYRTKRHIVKPRDYQMKVLDNKPGTRVGVLSIVPQTNSPIIDFVMPHLDLGLNPMHQYLG